MSLAVETSAGPVGPIIIGVSMLALVFGLWRAFRMRAAAMRVLASPLAVGEINDGAPGTAMQIFDAGLVPSKALMGALSRRVQTDADYESDDEGHGDMLGLTYHRWKHMADDWWEPIVYDGERNGRQVWIRLGRYGASLRGPGVGARRLRTNVTVRAAVPPLEVVADDGRLTLANGGSPELEAILGRMVRSPDVWRDLRVVGGPDGIAASRGITGDFLGGWIYDLWFLERLALFFKGPPLEPMTLGREWTPPYGLGSWAPSAFAG